MAPVTGYESKYSPQGMVWVGEKLLFSNSWNDTRSRVYHLNPENMEVLDYFDMPPEAVHTSGLGWDGTHIWAVDYSSNRIYQIELVTSFKNHKAEVLNSYPSGLQGTSACTIIQDAQKKYLAVSDFRNSKETIILDIDTLISFGNSQESIVMTYKNHGYSQGLHYSDGILYESENTFGKSRIYLYDFSVLLSGKDRNDALKEVIRGPGFGIEDIYLKNGKIWTSDEVSFRFYSGLIE